MAEEIEVAGLVTKIAIDDTGLSKSMAEIERQMKLVKSEFDKASAGVKDFGKGSEDLKVKADTLSKQLDLQATRVAKLAEEHRKSVEEKGADAVATQNLEVKLNKAAAEYNRLHGELTNTNDELSKQEKEAAIAASAWTKLGETLNAAGQKLQNAGKGMEDAGKSLTKNVTVPLTAVAGLSTKAAIDFESAFAGVRKTVDGTEAEFKALETGIRDMAKAIPASATEIAKVAEAAGQLGIKKESILGFTRTMTDLGVATNLSSDEAATALARLANITQMSQGDFDRLGSTIVALGNNLATTESEIVEMSLRLAGAGKQVGLTEAQILAFAGALSSVGIEAEAGGSAFSRVMIDISQAVMTGSKDLQTFAAVAGMSSSEFQAAFQKDAAGAILSFIEGLGQMSKSGQNTFGVLEDLGLSEIRVRDALLRASNAGDVFRDSIELGSKAWKENSALNKEAEQRYNTTASKLQVLKNRVTDVGITLGNTLIPAFTSALDAMEPFFKTLERGASAFSNMDTGTQRVIISLGAAAAALGPVLIMTGKIVTALGTLTKVFGAASTAAGAAGGATSLFGSAIAALTGPVGIAIASIAALTAAGIAAYKFFSKDAVSSVQRYGEEAQGAAQKASGSFAKFRQDTKDNLEQTTALAKTEGVKIGNNVASGVSAGTEEATKSLKKMIDTMKTEVDRSTTALNKIGDALSSALKKQYEEMEKLQTAALDKQLSEEQKASAERIKVYDQEYAEKLKLIDEEAYKKVKSLQAQIDQIDNQTEAEERAAKEQEYQAKLSELSKQLAAAETAEEREKIHGDLTKTIQDYERQQLLEQRKTAKESLKSQIEAIKETASAKKAELQQELEDKKTGEKDQLTELETRLNNEKTAIKTHYEELTSSEYIQAEARKLLIEQNNEEIVRLLQTYVPKWQDAGQSMADALTNGLNSENMTIADAVREALDISTVIDQQVSKLAELQGQLAKLEETASKGGGSTPIVDFGASVEQANELQTELSSKLQPSIAGVKESAKELNAETLKSFIGLKDQATVSLNELFWSGSKVTEETATTIADTFFAMGQTITDNLTTSHADQLEAMETFFSQSSVLTEEEKSTALQKVKQAQADEEKAVQDGQTRVAEIMSKALDEKRSLTQTEQQEINAIQNTMWNTAKRTLGEHELAQKTILEQMKADAANITTQQAAEVAKNSADQKNKAIEEAQAQYSSVVAEIIRQRDEVGSLTAEQADKLIADAKRQRDESVKAAEDMHKKVIQEAEAQAGEHYNKVDWETGEVLSRWQVFKNDVSQTWSDMVSETKRKLESQVSDVRNKYYEMDRAISEKLGNIGTSIFNWGRSIEDYFKGIDLTQIGADIINGLASGITGAWDKVKNATSGIGNGIKNTFTNIFDIHSPSRVMRGMGVNIGEGLQLGMRDTLDSIERQSAAMAAAAMPMLDSVSSERTMKSGTTGKAGRITNNSVNVTVNHRGDVRQESDINKIANAFGELVDNTMRGVGEVWPA